MKSQIRKLYKNISARVIKGVLCIPDSLRDAAQQDLNERVRTALRSLSNAASMRLYETPGVCFFSPGEARLDPSLPVACPSRGEVMVQMEYTAISPGTEGAQLNNLPNSGVRYPYTPGYLGVGTVMRVGHGVKIKRKQRVCGALPHVGLAVVREEDISVVPEGVDSLEASFLIAGLIALRSLERCEITSSTQVVVLGQGLIGQLLVQILKARDVASITVVTRTATRHELSRLSGADHCVCLNDVDQIKALAADLVFDVSPDPEGVSQALEITTDGGRIVLLGSSRGHCQSLDLDQLISRRITIEGAHARLGLLSPDHRAGLVRKFFALVSNGDVSVRRLDPRVLAPINASSFYRGLAYGRENNVATVFDWASSVLSVNRYWSITRLRPQVRGMMREAPIDVNVSDIADDVSYECTSKTTFTLRWAIVGAGEIGMSNARAIAGSKTGSIAYVVDTNMALAEGIAAEFGGQPLMDLQTVLEDKKVDAVFVCTPHHLHLPVSKSAVDLGKHVIVEKPLANNLDSARQMYEAIQNSSKRATVAFILRYENRIRYSKKIVSDGLIGEVNNIDLTLKVNKPPSYWTVGNSGRSKSDWRQSREMAGGGIIAMQLCHHFDLIRYITGLEVEDVNALCYLENGLEVESVAQIHFRCSNGAIGSVRASYLSRGEDINELIIAGSEGQVDVYGTRFFTARSTNGLSGNHWYRFRGFPQQPMRTCLVDDFAKFVHTGEQPLVMLDDGLRAQEIIERCYKT